MKKVLLFFLFAAVSNVCAQEAPSAKPQQPLSQTMYFCTAADESFFHCVLYLINSIHQHCFDKLGDIAVFDLGFNEQQRATLRAIQKVHVCQLELTNPDLLKPFQTTSWGKKVPGWYAWKPVALKQALERFPYVLYLDAGCVITKPLDDFFSYIQTHDYFLIKDPIWFVGGQNKQFTIGEQCTTFVLNKFNLLSPERQWILQQPPLLASVQGLTRAMLPNYVLPMYELTKDLRNFQDDGTGVYGFGWSRHDQTLFSIHARLLGLQLHEPNKELTLESEGKQFSMYLGDYAPAKPHIFYNCKGQVNNVDSIRWR